MKLKIPIIPTFIFKLIITWAAIFAIFLNHFDFQYDCSEEHKVYKNKCTMTYFEGGAPILKPVLNSSGSCDRGWEKIVLSETICDKYSVVPNGVEEADLSQRNNFGLPTDVLIFLIYIGLLYTLSTKKPLESTSSKT